jgi:hypothetical protein
MFAHRLSRLERRFATRPVKTLLRGALVADEGRVVGAPGMGQFQPRQTSRNV